ncbi:MAG TPA: AAA family ATPase, partial [Actinomycetota bacterium]|nr:AAA family ATPase [Actinomycetota bacterium]
MVEKATGYAPRSSSHGGANARALLGRDREIGILRSVLDDSTQGRLRIAMIEGDAGIGKSRVLARLASFATADGVSVFGAACLEHERARAFAPLRVALGCVTGATDPARVTLASLLSETTVSAGGNLGAVHFQAIDGFIDILERESLQTPVLLILDDLQWADPTTLAFLRTAAARLSFVALAIVLSMRPAPRDRTLGAALSQLANVGAVDVPLGPLDEDAVTALVRDATGAEPDARLSRFVARAEGNPLYVGEIIDALVRDGGIELRDDVATLVDGTLPPDLRRTILRRLAFLSDGAVTAIRLGSVLGSTFAPADLAVVMARPASALVEPLDECVKAGVLTEDGSTLRFAHDLIRESLYLDMTEGMRAALHRDAARSLAAAGAPPALVARHHAAGAAPGDLDAIDSIR